MATYLDIEALPKNAIAGFPHQFRVTARLASGAVDTAYTGTVTFSTDDPGAFLPVESPYTFTGPDAGRHLFRVRFFTPGARRLIADDGTTRKFTAPTTVVLRPPGWGFDDQGQLPYGDAVAGIGAHVVDAHLISTRQVAVSVSNLVQDNSPFLAGDALNPATWTLQRLDTMVFLHVVSVQQTGTYTYVLLTLEEFGPVTVTHKVGSTTLLDLAGEVINSPQYATFLGITDATIITLDAQLAARRVAVRDIANPQVAGTPFFAGTLLLGGDGDYVVESGPPLLRKLILRRLMSTPGDFFHLPDYGLGLRQKEPIPTTDLGRLKTTIEQQILREPELVNVVASISLATNGVLTVQVQAQERSTGEKVAVGYVAGQAAGVP